MFTLFPLAFNWGWCCASKRLFIKIVCSRVSTANSETRWMQISNFDEFLQTFRLNFVGQISPGDPFEIELYEQTKKPFFCQRYKFGPTFIVCRFIATCQTEEAGWELLTLIQQKPGLVLVTFATSPVQDRCVLVLEQVAVIRPSFLHMMSIILKWKALRLDIRWAG